MKHLVQYVIFILSTLILSCHTSDDKDLVIVSKNATLINALGQVQYSQNIDSNSKVTLNIGTLNSGLHYLKVMVNGESMGSKPFIKL